MEFNLQNCNWKSAAVEGGTVNSRLD